ncbi:hypothetical protein HDU98_003086 [Podochytrium sp. JEL0797]|nr:hypothetical protein HDU98_003086 [Podochytrium sp. JEL0797]
MYSGLPPSQQDSSHLPLDLPWEHLLTPDPFMLLQPDQMFFPTSDSMGQIFDTQFLAHQYPLGAADMTAATLLGGGLGNEALGLAGPMQLPYPQSNKKHTKHNASPTSPSPRDHRKSKTSSSSADFKKPEKILTTVKKRSTLAGGGGSSSSSSHTATSPNKTRVSISFKNIAAGITKDNYQPPPKVPRGSGEYSVYDETEAGKLVESPVVLDPELVNFSELKSEEERRKHAFKLNLNRALKLRLAEKKGGVVAGGEGGVGGVVQLGPIAPLGPQWGEDILMGYPLEPVMGGDMLPTDRMPESENFPGVLEGSCPILGCPNTMMGSNFGGVEGSLMGSGQKAQVSVKEKPRAAPYPSHKKLEKLTKKTITESPKAIEFQRPQPPPLPILPSTSHTIAGIPPIDTSAFTLHQHHNPTDDYNTPYSATLFNSGFSYSGQMLYLPVQAPMSPPDAFLSPSVSPQSSTSDNTTTGNGTRRSLRHRKGASQTSSQHPTPPSISSHATTRYSSGSSSASHPYADRQLSLGSLFNPALQSQLSNGQLLSQLGFAFSGSSSSL